MRSHRDLGPSSDDAASSAGAVGKRTLTASVQRRAAPAAPPATTALAAPTGDAGAGLDDPFGLHLTSPVQRAGGGAAGEDPARTQAIAAEGVAGSGGALPYLDTIQRSFGPAHDVGGIEAHVGGPAATAASAIGAEAYATGTRVAFGSSPDLHTAAHEAAHVVQQRAGVHLRGGVGEAGDRHEQHAADREGRTQHDLRRDLIVQDHRRERERDDRRHQQIRRRARHFVFLHEPKQKRIGDDRGNQAAENQRCPHNQRRMDQRIDLIGLEQK